jgi:membrane protease YdiL (CAAX protease family)
LQTPEYGPTETSLVETQAAETHGPETSMVETPPPPAASLAVAPAWHTAALVVFILGMSLHGASRFSVPHDSINLLATYGFTAVSELILLGWVLFGLRLRRTPLRSLLGGFSFSPRAVAVDFGFAMLFWISALSVLGTIGIAWSGVEAAVTHRALPTLTSPAQSAQSHGAPLLTRDPSQQQALRALSQLAPGNGQEIAAWVLLCLLVGFIEETVFRGYLQRQFTWWARGGVGAGVVLSALVFGGAHAYQGVRNMVLLGLFGAMFGVLALYRRSLRAGMFAHSWQDIIAGLGLALLKAHHLI